MNNDIDIAYETIFSLFISEIIPLREIDQMFCDKFKVKKDEKKMYEIGVQMPGMFWFRLLSRAHTERLEDFEISALSRIINNASEKSIKEACEIVERTFGRVMCINPDDSGNMTCIGPYPDMEFCFDNDAIVIGLIIDNILDIEDIEAERLINVIENMKTDMFPDLSKRLNKKIEFFVQVN